MGRMEGAGVRARFVYRKSLGCQVVTYEDHMDGQV